MNDTSPEIQERLNAMYAALSPDDKLAKCASMMAAGFELAEAAVRRRFPELEGPPLRAEKFRWIYQNSLPDKTLDYFYRRIKSEVP